MKNMKFQRSCVRTKIEKENHATWLREIYKLQYIFSRAVIWLFNGSINHKGKCVHFILNTQIIKARNVWLKWELNIHGTTNPNSLG